MNREMNQTTLPPNAPQGAPALARQALLSANFSVDFPDRIGVVRNVELQLEPEIVDTAHRLIHVIDDEADMVHMDVARPVNPALHLEKADVELVFRAEDAPANAIVYW